MLIKILNNKIKEFDDTINNLSFIYFNIHLTNKLYNNSFTGLMLIKYINKYLTNNLNKYKFLFILDIHKKGIT